MRIDYTASPNAYLVSTDLEDQGRAKQIATDHRGKIATDHILSVDAPIHSHLLVPPSKLELSCTRKSRRNGYYFTI